MNIFGIRRIYKVKDKFLKKQKNLLWYKKKKWIFRIKKPLTIKLTTVDEKLNVNEWNIENKIVNKDNKVKGGAMA